MTKVAEREKRKQQRREELEARTEANRVKCAQKKKGRENRVRGVWDVGAVDIKDMVGGSTVKHAYMAVGLHIVLVVMLVHVFLLPVGLLVVPALLFIAWAYQPILPYAVPVVFGIAGYSVWRFLKWQGQSQSENGD